MKNLQKLLQSMYGLSDDRALPLAKEFLEILMKKLPIPDSPQVMKCITDIPLDFAMWRRIREIAEKFEPIIMATKNAQNDENKFLAAQIKNFLDLADKRNKNLSMASTMTSKEAMPFCLAMTNLDPPAIRRVLDKFWQEFDQIRYSLNRLKKSEREKLKDGFDIGIVQQEIEKISDNLFTLEFSVNERVQQLRIELQAFEVMALLYHQNRHNKLMATKRLHPSRLNALHDFERCAFCWRFVPKSRTAKNKIPYCDFHNHDSKSKSKQTGYQRARELPCNSPDLGDSLPEETEAILKKLHVAFRVETGNLTLQEWYNALNSKISSLNLADFPVCEYDELMMKHVWHICPTVFKYINDHGGDPYSPASILKILDPCTWDETEEERYERECLHKFFAKNFALYRFELATAETFLSQYYKKWEGRIRSAQF